MTISVLVDAKCGIGQVTTAIARQLIETSDDIITVRPRDESRDFGVATAIRVASHAMLPDASLLRVTWELKAPAGVTAVTTWYDVEREGWHWQTRRVIAAGDVVEETDVVRVFGPVASNDRLVGGQWPTSPVRAARALPTGVAITNESLQPMPDFLVGESVRYRVSRGAVQIFIDATLQVDSSINHIARVKLAHNGEIAYGRMQASGTVESCHPGGVALSDRC